MLENLKTETEPQQNLKSKKSTKNKKDKPNLHKLSQEMAKLACDAVDKEIIKRFKIIIDSSPKDIPKVTLSSILNEEIEPEIYAENESLQPYVKHYLFMLKRKKNNENKNKDLC